MDIFNSLARQVTNTLSIKAIPQAEPTTPEGSQKVSGGSKLPPQLRRLKLSETISHDPLSPLRRYAGRIQNAVTANTSVFDLEELEMENIRTERVSRRSLSRRSSMISHRPRFSLGNSTIYEHTILNDSISEGGLNQTARTNIDLISLLKTPAIDHRLEKRQRLHGSINNVSCTPNSSSVGQFDESLFQPAHVHSIMKVLTCNHVKKFDMIKIMM